MCRCAITRHDMVRSFSVAVDWSTVMRNFDGAEPAKLFNGPTICFVILSSFTQIAVRPSRTILLGCRSCGGKGT